MISISSDNRSGSQRWCAKNLVFLIILLTLVSAQLEYTQADLEAMTEIELESICVQRGFQLVNDESDELTKQDYIEAAQRCLAIEQEMNELLAQYPELADELEEEIKKMEKENSEKQAYVEALESEVSNNDSAHHNTKDSDMALAGPLKDEETKNNDDYIADTKEVKEASTIETPENSMDIEHQDTTNNLGKNIESLEPSTKEQDLTLTHIAIESFRVLVKNAQDDVKRIINLAIPVLQPIFDAGDVAWRQMKALFIRAREVYEAYQAVNTPSDDVTDNTETYDDSEYS